MKKHKYSSTEITNHPDDSYTIKHVHEEGPHKDYTHAAVGLDSVHDSLQKHLNPEKIEDEVEKNGQDPEALEERVSPGIHQKVLDLSKEM